MKIYKLNYTDKKTAMADLLAKGVYVETTFEDITSLSYGRGIQAVVEIGKIVSKDAIIDENFNVISEAEYFSGYAFDIMCEQEIDFGTAEVIVKNPKHSFAGYEPIKEVQLLNIK